MYCTSLLHLFSEAIPVKLEPFYLELLEASLVRIMKTHMLKLASGAFQQFLFLTLQKQKRISHVKLPSKWRLQSYLYLTCIVNAEL
jgi:hypothetical protein